MPYYNIIDTLFIYKTQYIDNQLLITMALFEKSNKIE